MFCNLQTATEQAAYRAEIDLEFRQLKDRTDPRTLRRTICQTLDRLAKHASNPTGLSKANLRHLVRLVALVRPEDLPSNGGLLGGSNTWYAHQLGVEPETMTTIFRALKRAGMIVPHNPTANHRRACQRSADGTKAGRGYSLRPLLVRLPILQDWARELEREALTRQAKLGELTNLLKQIASNLPHLEPKVRDDLERQFTPLRNEAAGLTTRATLPAVTTLLHAAFTLTLDVETMLAKSRIRPEQIQDQSGKKSRQHHTDEKLDSEDVMARQDGSSRTGPPDREPMLKTGAQQNDDETDHVPATEGLSSGITLSEARHLFNEDAEHLPTSQDHEPVLIAASLLAERTAINPRLLGRSFETLGLMSTLWCLLLVRARHRRGEIRTTPGAYFNALIERAKREELDLDRSIWGERQRYSNAKAASEVRQKRPL